MITVKNRHSRKLERVRERGMLIPCCCGYKLGSHYVDQYGDFSKKKKNRAIIGPGYTAPGNISKELYVVGRDSYTSMVTDALLTIRKWNRSSRSSTEESPVIT